MKKLNDNYFATEGSDFRPFSEYELAMVLGGGGDEQNLDLLTHDPLADDDDDGLGS